MTRMHIRRYDVPLRSGSFLGAGRLASRAGLLIEVHGDRGEVGRGEAAPAYWIDGTDMEQLYAELRSFAESPAAEDLPAAFGEGFCCGRMPNLSAPALCAVETAALDLEAQKRGLAVAELLGGDREALVEVGALIAGKSADDVRRETAAFVERGFRVLKLKVGGTAPQFDVERVTAAREAGGGRLLLRLDANRQWEADEAAAVLAAIGPADIEYVEEPLRSPDLRALAALRRRTGLPIALDESISTADQIVRCAEAAACDTIVLKLARVGGPRRAVALAQQAHDCGLRVTVTDSIETCVGRSIALHVAGALPVPRQAVGSGGAVLLDREPGLREAPPLVPRAKVHGPGLGVTLG